MLFEVFYPSLVIGYVLGKPEHCMRKAFEIQLSHRSELRQSRGQFAQATVSRRLLFHQFTDLPIVRIYRLPEKLQFFFEAH